MEVASVDQHVEDHLAVDAYEALQIANQRGKILVEQ